MGNRGPRSVTIKAESDLVIPVESTRPHPLLVQIFVRYNHHQETPWLEKIPPLLQSGLGIVHVFETVRTVYRVIRRCGAMLQDVIGIAILYIEPLSPFTNQIIPRANVD
jgi:hypothetical protein